MGDDPEKTNQRQARPRIRRRGWLWLTLVLTVLFAALALIILGLSGRTIIAPSWIVERVETRANAALAGQSSVEIGGIDIFVDEAFVPHVRLRDVDLISGSGKRIAVLPDLRTTLHGKPILSGRIEPRLLRATGVRIDLQRYEDGRLDIAAGDPSALADGAAMSMSDVLKTIDDFFELPALKGVDGVEISSIALRLSDARSGQVWTADNAWISMKQDRKRVVVDVGLSLAEEGSKPARVKLSFETIKASPEARFTAAVTDVSASDLAAQSTALAWLGALDAPISGSIESGVGKDGQIEELSATLELGAGALRPTADTQPVEFDKVGMALRYDFDRAMLTFSQVTVDSPSLRVSADGKAWLKNLKDGVPGALVGQIRIKQFAADPEAMFANPVSFTQGALDLRMELSPFRVDLGQMVLLDGDRRIGAKGKFTAEPEGWAVDLDVDINAIERERLIALWPVSMVPLTRKWLDDNVATSELFDARAALRLRPGQEPHFSLGYEYRSTDVRILRSLPPIQDGAGYAVVNDYSYTLVVDKGHVTAPEGGQVDVAGSVLSIPDLRIIPAPAIIRLRTKSDITGALSLLDQPPFQFLSKAGQAVDIAEGRAEADAELKIVLAAKVEPKDVVYKVSAKLLDIHSQKIAPGQVLEAAELDLTADPSGITITGPGAVSGVPVNVSWRQNFRPEEKGRSRVEGTVELSRRFLETFGIGLPAGAVNGTGEGQITLELEKGKETKVTLTSDLTGLELAIPELGWRKPAASSGRLLVRARLGSPVSIDRLEIEGAGLSASGKVFVAATGELDRVLLGKISVGNWFDGQVELVGRGKGRNVGVIINGGRADMRQATLGGSNGGDTPVTISLDRLEVSDGIALTGFRGEFTSRGGFAGEFRARVNGQAPVSGTVAPFEGRAGFRVRSEDAGEVMRAAGIFERGLGGSLDLSLRPVGQAGHYEGTVVMTQIRVTDAPVLASMLDAISVVGLLSQLNGPGILFGNVSGDFRLTPSVVEITRGSAVGASLGISAAGIYDTSAKRVDLQGTISPLYALNGIGQIFSKRGEGLFGFNYRMRGPVDAPAVTINPLSILTPGMFREIFRSNPPKVTQ